MSHFIKICKRCNTVISQCRCPSPNKEVIWDVCDSCAAQDGDVNLDSAQKAIEFILARLEARWVEVTVFADGRLWLNFDHDTGIHKVHKKQNFTEAFSAALRLIE